MPKTIIHWDWEEAFYAHGFQDGDGWNGTELVRLVLEDEGWQVEANTWGIHNYMIQHLKGGPVEITVDGEADPRTYLPPDLVAALDAALPEDKEFHEGGDVLKVN